MPPPAHLLKPIRDLCQVLPDVEEVGEGSVGDPVWKVRQRIFVMQHGHEGKPSLWIKAPAGLQEILVGSQPELWFRPPYVGHKGWVGVWLNELTPWPDVLDLVEDGWRLTASKTQVRTWEAAQEPSST